MFVLPVLSTPTLDQRELSLPPDLAMIRQASHPTAESAWEGCEQSQGGENLGNTQNGKMLLSVDQIFILTDLL